MNYGNYFKSDVEDKIKSSIIYTLLIIAEFNNSPHRVFMYGFSHLICRPLTNNVVLLKIRETQNVKGYSKQCYFETKLKIKVPNLSSLCNYKQSIGDQRLPCLCHRLLIITNILNSAPKRSALV